MAQSKEEINAKARARMAAHRETQAYRDWLVASRELRRALKEKYRREAGAWPLGARKKQDAHVKAWQQWPAQQKEQARLFFLRLGWKLCGKCKMLHRLDDFCVVKSNKDGLNKICKECDKSKHLERRRNCPITNLKHNIRVSIYLSLRKKGYAKSSRTHEILGCDFDTFVQHIERQFTKGMSWDKVGKAIHIDHIVPLASATTEQEVLALNHYTNLRPLWAEKNLSKSAKHEFLI